LHGRTEPRGAAFQREHSLKERPGVGSAEEADPGPGRRERERSQPQRPSGGVSVMKYLKDNGPDDSAIVLFTIFAMENP
jgi:hypothetical protein